MRSVASQSCVETVVLCLGVALAKTGRPQFWGAHAPRVLIAAPRRNVLQKRRGSRWAGLSRLTRKGGRQYQANSSASLSVFKDKAGADESVRLAAAFLKEHLYKLLTQKPEIIEGPVKAHD